MTDVGSKRRAARAVGLLVVAAMALTATPAGAELAAPFQRSRSSTAALATAAASATPPPGGTLVHGEALAGSTAITNTGAHAGAYGRTLRGSAPAGVAPGTFLLTGRVKAPVPTRLDLLVGEAMVGSYRVSTAWKTVTAVVTITDPYQTVGAGSWARYGTTAKVDVDWLHLAEMAPQLTVRGNQILDRDGAGYQPRGFNRGGFQEPTYLEGRLRGPALEADAIHAWGPTMVRIGLNQEFWLADCASWAGPVATTYRTAVAAEVDALTAKGVEVMLSLVSSERGKTTGCAITPGAKREMADWRSLQFWTSVAGSFKDNDRVVFDLFNEPHDISPKVWRYGGKVYYGGGSYTAYGMQALYNAVRGTGATNLVSVSGRGWAADPRTHLSYPLDGYGIVAASHFYCHTCTNGEPFPAAKLAGSNSPELRARHPLILAEFGWAKHWEDNFNRGAIDWAEANAVGWLAYAWLSHTASGPDVYSIVGTKQAELDVGLGVTTRSPSQAGVPVWNSLAPWRTAQGFDEVPLPE